MKTALVTGASSGIGAATARQLAAAGYRVICAARREDRIVALAQEIGGSAVVCDITSDDDVTRLAAAVGDRLDVLVNNAGGALGLEPVAEADLDRWATMIATNTIGTARVTKALLPALVAAEGVIVFVTSLAADAGYEGGAGYCAAKAGERAVVESLRLELFDQPVRITEIAPGMVQTEEFALTRFDGDRERADKVYAGVAEPLTADDVADVIVFMATRPSHVNIDRLAIRPRAQAASHKVHRTA
ncbi:SDR family NAD(P)-dependent oxidoreductase [Tessaracoccus sp. MC1865]|uniref:SDR family NAD(P)-dependent oxidoreductase n=1 Tax=Tessaracoccus sp. MC1865 TaxID=2760310 RepID=UPI001601F384|nr:SDR family NAD(P)-dependent oxidoreductase [Tessaracoccus sp. MC1865]MBB1482567.1 SDR family NAD(P)-dependent oxidoreductase [Tessaracoccus sp. MC1865]QTO37980.1 SDR family NAD(P)-dependent oxidoreductase [Tessaracoccus sp. MC1865]